MHVLVAGATGAIGRLLVPMLIEQGHQVTGISRSRHGVTQLRAAGARAVQLDVFERAPLMDVMAAAEPDVVMHQLTDLANGSSADNARIRSVGTRNLVDAAKNSGVRRIVAQSISWAYQPGEQPADEGTPLDVAAAAPRARTIEGVRALEDAVAEIDDHVILRYGTLYGPGTWYAPGGLMAEKMRAGQLRANAAVTSFLHVADAAQAAVLALSWPSGVLNIVDDEPATGQEWVPVLAEALGAIAPPPVPGRAGWERGADNTLARNKHSWQPIYSSWRIGFTALARG